jgi:monoamine oxidase
VINEFDIIVIGAGAAGIGAARRLAEHGLSTLVLEALPRLGGRGWTHNVGGFSLDLGCGIFHSADRNPWVGIAEAQGFAIDRREAGWTKPFAGPAFNEADQLAARQAFRDWCDRLVQFTGASDRASDVLEPGGPWNGYVRAIASFMSGVEPERISAADYAAYDAASTGRNWRTPLGYGNVVAASLPISAKFRLATPAERIDISQDGVVIATRAGSLQARAAILTVSTSVLTGDTIRLPAGLDPWREAASRLPLGRNEKLFLEVADPTRFEPEDRVFGSLRDSKTAAYHVRPFGWPVIQAYLGGESARMVEAEGPTAGFSHVINELAGIFGNDVRSIIRPIAASSWGNMPSIGGAYSCALPGHAAARARLARPYENRLFFAGEATHGSDFSTAHGAYDSGRRAADEACAALRT